MIEQLAVITYGVVATAAALVLSVQTGSPIATALVFAAAGLTYVLQVAELDGRPGYNVMVALWLLVIVTLLGSVTVSLWSYI